MLLLSQIPKLSHISQNQHHLSPLFKRPLDLQSGIDQFSHTQRRTIIGRINNQTSLLPCKNTTPSRLQLINKWIAQKLFHIKLLTCKFPYTDLCNCQSQSQICIIWLSNKIGLDSIVLILDLSIKRNQKF